MRKLEVLLAVLVLAAAAANASNQTSLGYSHETSVGGAGPDACADGTLTYNHDDSFENGYAWQYGGIVTPYYGAFGEGYDLGAGTVFCSAHWLSQVGNFFGQTADCYLWEGGAGSDPGAVLGVVTGVVFQGIGFWPSITQHNVDMNIAVTGPFTVGYWGNWPGAYTAFYCAADLDGYGGYPWTNIAPAIGYPTGWQDPSVVWGPTQSMGNGVYFGTGGPSPVEAWTWGCIKALFQ